MEGFYPGPVSGILTMASEAVKTIGILIPTLQRGGAEKQAALLAASLRLYCRVYLIVLCPSHGLDPDLVRLSGLEDAHIVRMKDNPRNGFFELRDFLRTHSVDTLFCYLTRADLLGPIAGRQAGVRRIYQGVRTSYLPLWKRVLEHIGSLWADGVIFNSMAGRRHLSHLKPGRAMVIRNCLDNTPVIPLRCPGVSGGKLIVVTSARFVRSKGYPVAVEAMRMAMSPELDPKKRLHWLILGQGPEEAQIRGAVEKAGIAGRVTLISESPEAARLLIGSDIYFSASRQEGMSNSLMEAMAAGLPVVATDAGDTATLVGDGGFIAPVGDAEGLAQFIARLARDAKLRRKMGSCGLERVHRICSRETFMDSYRRLLKESVPTNKGDA